MSLPWRARSDRDNPAELRQYAATSLAILNTLQGVADTEPTAFLSVGTAARQDCLGRLVLLAPALSFEDVP